MKTPINIFILYFLILFYQTSSAQMNTVTSYGNRISKIKQDQVKKKPGNNLNFLVQEKAAAIRYKREIHFYHPLKNIIVTSPYGWRKHPVTGKWRFHKGVDLRAYYEPVYVVADGVVKYAGWGDIEGYYVVIHHGNAESVYCHLSKLHVQTNELVKGGQVLGISGNTGRSTGPHLHFQIK